MATFVFTQALNSYSSVKNTISSRVNYLNRDNLSFDSFDYNKTKWRKDKITNKLAEISIQTSTYNKVIPKFYGTVRLAGNVIWLDEVVRVANDNTTTIKVSKGQKIKQTSIEYFYFLSFAIAIAGNKIDKINNIWADNQLLNLNDYNYRFYNGEQTDIDPLIFSKDPTLPAYKDLSYIVFENFPISQFNNRIPNFIFEVVRKDEYSSSATKTILNSIDGIKFSNRIGNFSYSISKIEKANYPYTSYEDFLNGGGNTTVLNCFNNSKISDCQLSFQQLNDTIKDYKYCVVGANFFATDVNIANTALTPRSEIQAFFTEPTYFEGFDIFLRPYDWKVGNFNRKNTSTVNKNYYDFGTTGDNAILEFVAFLKNHNKKIVFCPNIFIENNSRDDGSCLTGAVEEIHNFFTKNNGYNSFILHYANLLKDCVDVFLIGNQLSKLTCIKDNNSSFPAVDELINLADLVRNIVGNSVKISYSANYKEYHSCDNWYNLDKLWSNSNIAFVGIKAYFPLTEATQTETTKQLIKQYWQKGEGYDYITVDNIRQNITEKQAYKNIKYWWENLHTNPNGITTSWQSKMKKIWFLEFGFPSVNCCANEPYKVYNGVDKQLLPKFSNGTVDFNAQKLAIESTVEWCREQEYIEKIFLNCWDLRPQPFYPNNISIWNDCENWKYNYDINDKINNNNVYSIIYQLMDDSGISFDNFEPIKITEFVDGLIVNNSITVRDVLYILQKAYFFDSIEKYDKICFISNKREERQEESPTEINENDLIQLNNSTDENKIFFKIDNTMENILPKQLSLIYFDKNYSYDFNLVYSLRETNIDSQIEEIDNLPVVLTETKARNIANTIINNRYLENNIFYFSLPLKYLYLDVNDLVKFSIKNSSYILKITNININNNKINIVAVRFDYSIYENRNEIKLNDNIIIEEDTKQSDLIIFEIPTLKNFEYDKGYLFFAIGQNGKNFSSSNLYYTAFGLNEYQKIMSINNSTVVGFLVDFKDSGYPYYIDYSSEFKIHFFSFCDKSFMKNVDMFELLSGENLILLGEEILQYQEIVLNQDGSYSISKLLRGLYGTENKISGHRVGERFIFLKTAVYQEYSFDMINYKNSYKLVNIDDDLVDVKEKQYTLTGANLKPLKVCHLKLNGNILTWERVDRGYRNWLNNIENPTAETEEKYFIQVYINNILIYKNFIYERQFNIENIIQNHSEGDSIKITVCQFNNLYGYGENRKIVV